MPPTPFKLNLVPRGQERREAPRRQGDRRLEQWSEAARAVREDRRRNPDRRQSTERRAAYDRRGREPRIRYGPKPSRGRYIALAGVAVIASVLVVQAALGPARDSLTAAPTKATPGFAMPAPASATSPGLASSADRERASNAAAEPSMPSIGAPSDDQVASSRADPALQPAGSTAEAVSNDSPVPSTGTATPQELAPLGVDATTTADVLPSASVRAEMEAPAATPSTPSARSVSQPAAVRGGADAEAGPKFAIAMGSYRDRSVAAARMESLSERAPNHLFFLAPVEVGGRVFQRLLAGFTDDQASALGRSAALSDLLGEPSTDWLVREAPLAFELGRTPIESVAEALKRDFENSDLPAYVLPVQLEGEAFEYRVYVGAYADETEASLMRAILNSKGLDASALVRLPGIE